MITWLIKLGGNRPPGDIPLLFSHGMVSPDWTYVSATVHVAYWTSINHTLHMKNPLVSTVMLTSDDRSRKDWSVSWPGCQCLHICPCCGVGCQRTWWPQLDYLQPVTCTVIRTLVRSDIMRSEVKGHTAERSEVPPDSDQTGVEELSLDYGFSLF